ncbi:hypothetical protein VTI28DRAFT_597 [Corynascus sepedonium]
MAIYKNISQVKITMRKHHLMPTAVDHLWQCTTSQNIVESILAQERAHDLPSIFVIVQCGIDSIVKTGSINSIGNCMLPTGRPGNRAKCDHVSTNTGGQEVDVARIRDSIQGAGNRHSPKGSCCTLGLSVKPYIRTRSQTVFNTTTQASESKVKVEENGDGNVA